MRIAPAFYLASLIACSGLGCSSVVKGGGDALDADDGGTADDGASQESGGGGTGPSGVGAGDVGAGVGSGGAGDDGPPPIQANNIAGYDGDLLNVSLGNFTETCGPAAFGHYPENYPPCVDETTWQASLRIPVAALQVGAVLSMADVGYGAAFTAAEAEGYCGGGFGTSIDGTVEVLAIAPGSIRLRLSGTDLLLGDDDGLPIEGDGDYDVVVCPDAEPVQLLTSAVATADPYGAAAMTLVLANLAPSCADPHHYDDVCGVEVDTLSIDVSNEMLAGGAFPLQGIVTWSTRSPGEDDTCSMGEGNFMDGTVEILAVDADQVTFVVDGTNQFWTSQGNADGTFVAAHCD